MRAQQEAAADDDVELARDELADVAQVEHDHVQLVAGQLDLGALVLLGDVLDHERVEPEQLADLLEQRAARLGDVDPEPFFRRGEGGPHVVEVGERA